jgi:hypothetical protein
MFFIAFAIATTCANVCHAETAPKPAKPAAGEPDAGKTDPGKGDPDKGDGKFDVNKDLFYGVGIGLTQNLGGRRTNEDFIVAEVGGKQFVQISESQDTDIRVLFETHALFKNQHVFGNEWEDAFASFAACGPFALVGDGPEQRRGCGPFFAIALEPDAQVAEFGMGWFIGFGGDKTGSNERDTGFGFGFGFLIDPDSRTIDGRIVDTTTMYVRPEFQAAVAAKTVAITTKETTTSLLLMVGKDF